MSIKSGPNWGNSSQIKKMVSDFNTAIRTLRTGNSKMNIIHINGCCYGRDKKPYKAQNYYKYCGQKFWEFISGEPDLYIKIIEPLGSKAKVRSENFIKSYSRMINKFTIEFGNNFCDKNGNIDWNKLVMFNSSESINS